MILVPVMEQNPEEFRHLLALFEVRRPGRILEVGAGSGGTLAVWCLAAPAGALVVSVDDRQAHTVTPPRQVQLVTIKGRSQDPDTLRAVAAWAPFDWVFIDADHTAAAVRADWENLLPLAADDAVIALHDILPSSDPTIQVDGLWAELREAYHTVQYDFGGNGIGVVFV